MNNKVSIVKVGGSVLSINDNELFSFDYAKDLRGTLDTFDQKFVLCIGGGYVCRKYQDLLKKEEVGELGQHNVGIALINVNASILQSIFVEDAKSDILRYEDYDSESELKFEDKYLITAAGSPGHSSDWNTVKLALRAGSKEVISLKNVDAVYTADPDIYPNAQRIEKLSWDEYLDIIGNPEEHKPGASYPVDPLASKLAKENGIKFYIVGGNNLTNISSILKGEKYKGSLIY